MSEHTAIAWTDHTFNPWWGCERVSPGCNHCYAETFAKRTGHDVWGKKAERRFFGDKHWAEPLKWNRQAEDEGRRHRVFCASMADVFEQRPELVSKRDRLWELICATPCLDWQVLTKRPQHAWDVMPPNAWIGTTVEDQQRAEERIPELLRIEASVRFLSCEPLLGPVTFRWGKWHRWRNSSHLDALRRLDWVIVGGESGPRHRPINLDWARTIRDECAEAGVPFFFKQVGGRTPKAGGDLLDGMAYKQFPASAVAA